MIASAELPRFTKADSQRGDDDLNAPAFSGEHHENCACYDAVLSIPSGSNILINIHRKTIRKGTTSDCVGR